MVMSLNNLISVDNAALFESCEIGKSGGVNLKVLGNKFAKNNIE